MSVSFSTWSKQGQNVKKAGKLCIFNRLPFDIDLIWITRSILCYEAIHKNCVRSKDIDNLHVVYKFFFVWVKTIIKRAVREC